MAKRGKKAILFATPILPHEAIFRCWGLKNIVHSITNSTLETLKDDERVVTWLWALSCYSIALPLLFPHIRKGAQKRKLRKLHHFFLKKYTTLQSVFCAILKKFPNAVNRLRPPKMNKKKKKKKYNKIKVFYKKMCNSRPFLQWRFFCTQCIQSFYTFFWNSHYEIDLHSLH